MRARIMSIGSELLRGDIIDRNAAFLARELSHLGIEVDRVQQFGDDLGVLTDAFVDALASVDLTVCTGGLGPTADDLTRQAIANAVGEQPQVDQSLLAGIAERFAAMGRAMPASNEQQAWLIPSAETLLNPHGTAPGWYVQQNGHAVAAMPGPPVEMEPMWTEQVLPRVAAYLDRAVATQSLITFGVGESTVEERVRPVIQWRPDVTVATYAKAAGVEVHVTARAEHQAEADALLAEAEGRVRELLGDAVFGTGTDTLASVVGATMTAKDMTIATMESATGGALASMLTDVEGSSAYFLGGLVAYSRDAKAAGGVPTDIMDRYGLVSEETARAMARAVRERFGSGVGVATTGVAGRTPVEGKAPGTVYVAVSIADGEEQVAEVRRPGERQMVKRHASLAALDLVWKSLRR